MAGWTIEVTGLRQIMSALEQVDKKAAKAIQKRITDAAKMVAVEASYLVPGRNPISNWGTWFSSSGGRDLSFDPAVAAGGFKVRRNSFRRRGVSAGLGWDVYQTNPGGAIFELVGSGSGQFVESVSERFRARQPRTLIPAYYAGVPEGMADEIADEILTEARKAGLV